jgi:hypothetical protein
MSKYDRHNEIIKGFVEVRQIKPSPNELHAFYNHFINEDKYTSKDVIKIINDDGQFKSIILNFEKENFRPPDVNKTINPEVQSFKSNSINEVEDSEQAGILVKKSYDSLFPGEKLTSSNKDFLMYKLNKFGNNIKKFEEYLTSDKEYHNFIKKKVDGEFKNHLTNDEKDDTIFQISTPNLNKTTLIKTSKKRIKNQENIEGSNIEEKIENTITCKDLEDEHVLSKIINERNLSELKYACLRSKNKYANVDENMVLIPELKWSVPQEHPEVCRMNGKFNYQPSTEQTALIGTLLDASKDTQVGSILPDFKFDESL